MGAETRARSTAVESERAAYDEGAVLERSNAWVQRVHHVLETPNTVRGERLFARLIAESVRNGGRVLDIGCATGQTARQAVELGASEVLAVDLSRRFLEEAERLGDGEGKIEYRLHDLHDPLDGRFDLVVGRAVLHHIDWRSFLQRTFTENLHPGGQMVFMEPMTHPMTVAFHRLVRSAHTPGEYPLSQRDVRWLEQTFTQCRVHPINFLSFPAGVLSSYLFRTPDNALTRATDAIDRRLAGRRSLRGYGRQGILEIEKPSSNGVIRQDQSGAV
jgi:2-polyprenyl-3-methyl-5-hydroxy-6-metoxy-1,4-benzoquinol methylase